MPDTIETPFWNDRINGPGRRPRLLSDAPVVLAELGPAPMLEVPSTAPALRMQVFQLTGGQKVAVVGYDRVDENTPFRVGPTDIRVFDLPAGA